MTVVSALDASRHPSVLQIIIVYGVSHTADIPSASPPQSQTLVGAGSTIGCTAVRASEISLRYRSPKISFSPKATQYWLPGCSKTCVGTASISEVAQTSDCSVQVAHIHLWDRRIECKTRLPGRPPRSIVAGFASQISVRSSIHLVRLWRFVWRKCNTPLTKDSCAAVRQSIEAEASYVLLAAPSTVSRCVAQCQPLFRHPQMRQSQDR